MGRGRQAGTTRVNHCRVVRLKTRFYGVCNFCNSSVNFIIRHAPVCSQKQSWILLKNTISNISSQTHYVFIKNNHCFIRTDAALEITKDLSGYWYLLNVFRITPDHQETIFTVYLHGIDIVCLASKAPAYCHPIT